MAKTYGFNVRISSPHELMGVPTVPLDKESYIEGLHNCRGQIEKHTKPELLDALFARDPDSLRTYTQMSRFYEIDLKYTPVMQGLSARYRESSSRCGSLKRAFLTDAQRSKGLDRPARQICSPDAADAASMASLVPPTHYRT